MSTEKRYFALRLRALRHEAKMSQPELAEAAGLAVSTVRQFEYSRREPTYETLVKLAQGLGVSLSAFDPPEDKPAKGRKRKGE